MKASYVLSIICILFAVNASAASGTFYPTASGATDDDADVGAGMDPDDDMLYIGRVDPNDIDFVVRFRSVTIPKGATINTAIMRVTAYSSASGNNVLVRIQGELDATPDPFTDKTDYDARVRTTALEDDGPLAAWTDGTQYDSDDIADVVQEITDLAGWSSGNNMVIFWQNNGSTHNHYRAASAVEWQSGSEVAELIVDWTPPAGGGAQLIMVNE